MFKMIYKCTNKIKDKVAALSAKLNEKGQGITEYAIILAAVALIAVAALWGGSDNGTGLKGAIDDAFGNAKTAITTANGHTGSTSGGSNNNNGGGNNNNGG